MTALHPTLRLLLLLLTAIALPFADLTGLLIIQVGFLVACSLVGAIAAWAKGLWRLKWLFLSIAILYGWFTPGLPVIDVIAVRMPTEEGLLQAMQRLLLLSVLLTTVMWALAPMSPAQTAAALSSLLKPLKVCGVAVDRFSLRVSLTLAAVSSMQSRLRSNNSNWLEGAGQALAQAESGELSEQQTDGASLALDRAPSLVDVFVLGVAGLAIVAIAFGVGR